MVTQWQWQLTDACCVVPLTVMLKRVGRTGKGASVILWLARYVTNGMNAQKETMTSVDTVVVIIMVLWCIGSVQLMVTTMVVSKVRP